MSVWKQVSFTPSEATTRDLHKGSQEINKSELIYAGSQRRGQSPEGRADENLEVLLLCQLSLLKKEDRRVFLSVNL